MSSRDNETDERKLEFGLRQESRVEMAFEVMDADDRLLESVGDCLGSRDADDERSDQAGPIRDRDSVDFRQRYPGGSEGFVDNREDKLNMPPGGNFRDHPTPLRVEVGLTCDDVGEDMGPVLDYCGRRFVAA